MSDLEFGSITSTDASSVLGHFDSIIFLTSSDWFTEPRSNRFHFATRFAKHLPVLFVQFDQNNDQITTEPTEFDNITIVHAFSGAAPSAPTPEAPNAYVKSTAQALWSMGGHRALVWVYNPFSSSLIEALNPPLAIYHATEIYLAPDDSIFSADRESLDFLIAETTRVIETVDLIFAVSDGVYDTIASTGLASDKLVLNPNGVDARFWLDHDAITYVITSNNRPVVLYQGGINDRINHNLVKSVCEAMPDWDFWFCGRETTTSNVWKKTKLMSNVKTFGQISPDEIAELAKSATVAWTPFREVEALRTSLPLKMFEYVACGLPVVSTPINALLNFDENLFRFARDPQSFINDIRSLRTSRTDGHALALRKKTAIDNSYDARFEVVIKELRKKLTSGHQTKSVLVLYDDKYSTLPAIDWHLRSFERYSKHQFFYVPGSIVDGMAGHDHIFPFDTGEDLGTDKHSVWDFSKFDAILIHFSLRTTIEGYIPKALSERLAKFRGPKILFAQDEYDHVNMTHHYIHELGITDVFTCVPPEGRDYVYPKETFPRLNFQSTLTGYLPEDQTIEQYAIPLAERSIFIGYRGRQLPHHYGALGHEKMVIGQIVKREAEARGFKIDIETDDSKRIYTSWHQFLGSCRATLGTESGCNIFDFDDTLRAKASELSGRSFDEVYEKHFRRHEAPFLMNQISPKFFEAILLRTALVCFPGTYSGILEANEHYIALEKDFSNMDQVFEKLQDDEYVKKLTDRAYTDIVASGKHTYRQFVKDFDDWLDLRIPFGGTKMITVPVAFQRGKRTTAIHHRDARDYVLTSSPLGGSMQRANFRNNFSPAIGRDAYPLTDVMTFTQSSYLQSLPLRHQVLSALAKRLPSWLLPAARISYLALKQLVQLKRAVSRRLVYVGRQIINKKN